MFSDCWSHSNSNRGPRVGTVARAFSVACCFLAFHQRGAGALKVRDPLKSKYDMYEVDLWNQMLDLSDCEEYPARCKEPFNCNLDPVLPYEQILWNSGSIATPDGHPNPRVFCRDGWDTFSRPVYTRTMSCYNNEKNWREQYYMWHFREADQKQKDDTMDLCYKEKLCDTGVANVSSIEEQERLCDQKYGREAWTSVNFGQEHTYKSVSRNIASSFKGKMSCAMGTFQCDALFCRDIVCNLPEFKELAEKVWPFENEGSI